MIHLLRLGLKSLERFLGRPLQILHRLVVRDLEENEGDTRADEGAEHVALGVPTVALGAEKGLRSLCGNEGRCPFNEFIHGADGHADRNDTEGHPATFCDDLVTDEDFSANDCGDEALHEMTEAVIVVAREVKGVFRPITDGNQRVGVAAADSEDNHVQADQDEG